MNEGGSVKKMSESNIENMLSQLIRMVGTIQTNLEEMKQDMDEMKQDMDEMKREQLEMKREQLEMKREQLEMKQVQHEMQVKLDEIETKGEERHKEILARFKALEQDQDFIWEKTARNEREIGNIKRQLS